MFNIPALYSIEQTERSARGGEKSYRIIRYGFSENEFPGFGSTVIFQKTG